MVMALALWSAKDFLHAGTWRRRFRGSAETSRISAAFFCQRSAMRAGLVLSADSHAALTSAKATFSIGMPMMGAAGPASWLRTARILEAASFFDAFFGEMVFSGSAVQARSPGAGVAFMRTALVAAAKVLGAALAAGKHLTAATRSDILDEATKPTLEAAARRNAAL